MAIASALPFSWAARPARSVSRAATPTLTPIPAASGLIAIPPGGKPAHRTTVGLGVLIEQVVAQRGASILDAEQARQPGEALVRAGDRALQEVLVVAGALEAGDHAVPGLAHLLHLLAEVLRRGLLVLELLQRDHPLAHLPHVGGPGFEGRLF